MSEKVIIIGAGISGVTTAVTLELLGYNTEIITAKHPNKIDHKNAHPEFASLFPSASVIPHSVYSDRFKEIFLLSQATFYELRKQLFPGVTIHRHFEVFESDPGKPEYTDWMLNFNDIDEEESNAIPKRPDAPALHGWVFDCIFADWSLYFPALIELYKKTGGEFNIRKLDRKDIQKLPADLVINCSGTGAPELFDDPSDEQLIMRGHLLHKPDAPLIQNDDGEIISYNYEPIPSVYADASGEACDVYCYPRKDGWILGGSRQIGSLNSKSFEEQTGPLDKIDNIQFSSQIIDLNNAILEYSYNQSVKRTDNLSATMAYRYIRNREDGLRLEMDSVSGKNVYHNYGHGGAGVTLSWGCALHIAEQLTSRNLDDLQTSLLSKMENRDL